MMRAPTVEKPLVNFSKAIGGDQTKSKDVVGNQSGRVDDVYGDQIKVNGQWFHAELLFGRSAVSFNVGEILPELVGTSPKKRGASELADEVVTSDLFRESGANISHTPETIAKYAKAMEKYRGWGKFPPIYGRVETVTSDDVARYAEMDAEGYAHELSYSRPLIAKDIGKRIVQIENGHNRAYAAAGLGISIPVVDGNVEENKHPFVFAASSAKSVAKPVPAPNKLSKAVDAVRPGDVFRAPSGEAVTVLRALPGGTVQVRIQGKRLRLGDFKNNELKAWAKIGRAIASADYVDGAYTTPQSLIDLAKNQPSAPADSGDAPIKASKADKPSPDITRTERYQDTGETNLENATRRMDADGVFSVPVGLLSLKSAKKNPIFRSQVESYKKIIEDGEYVRPIEVSGIESDGKTRLIDGRIAKKGERVYLVEDGHHRALAALTHGFDRTLKAYRSDVLTPKNVREYGNPRFKLVSEEIWHDSTNEADIRHQKGETKPSTGMDRTALYACEAKITALEKATCPSPVVTDDSDRQSYQVQR